MFFQVMTSLLFSADMCHCTSRWGLNNPLKQNMLIGAGVARAIETSAEVDQVSN